MNTFLKVQLTLKTLPMLHRKRFALNYILFHIIKVTYEILQ